ncbi:MAG TPA: hypothetical protein VMB34_16360 [Acetobacteraceae bacterium]|nr:hypothetical protein [Acetobacteraceae bacterium]
MSQPAAIAHPAEAAMTQQDCLCHGGHPLRTATGFVLGSVLSGAMWTLAGALAWCLT